MRTNALCEHYAQRRHVDVVETTLFLNGGEGSPS